MLAEVQIWINAHYPYWSRKGGRDHIWVCGGAPWEGWDPGAPNRAACVRVCVWRGVTGERRRGARARVSGLPRRPDGEHGWIGQHGRSLGPFPPDTFMPVLGGSPLIPVGLPTAANHAR